jgi:hypothetical protein
MPGMRQDIFDDVRVADKFLKGQPIKEKEEEIYPEDY